MMFYLGTHEPAWLPRSPVPLFLSARSLARRVSLPRARCDWALDSGAFTELAQFGRWRATPDQYAATCLLYEVAIGRLQWVAPQDWPCEPTVLCKTGRSIDYHQQATVANFGALRARLGTLVIPVLQGWTASDYATHASLYAARGFDLTRERLVGVGTMCRRQHTSEALAILRQLHDIAPLHAFGFKVKGLRLAGDLLASADSLAWSIHARYRPPLPGCTHANCQNCLRYALWWRTKIAGVPE